METPKEACTDVVELCALLQCLGFSVKSLDTSDGNISHDGGARTVIINCTSSGLHVVLESGVSTCSCPDSNLQNSGVWQVAGTTGGKHIDKEFGSTLLGSLPKTQRDRLSRELRDIMRHMKDHNESDTERLDIREPVNKSASMIEMQTPERRLNQLKTETPTRYRSLDTLTMKDKFNTIPTPGVLLKSNMPTDISADEAKSEEIKTSMCRRQSTYTLCSTPSSIRRRDKTSSPIQLPSVGLLENLISVEKSAEDLRKKLSLIVREFMDECKNDSSMSSLALDVSKISVLKATESMKSQFVSSPNLSGLGVNHDDSKTRLNRFESASTSNLAMKKTIPGKESKMSKLMRISPSLFKSKKNSPVNIERAKPYDTRSKLNSLLKPKIVTPIRTPKSTPEPSPSLSGSRKKYSHIKSTIPRPTPKKD